MIDESTRDQLSAEARVKLLFCLDRLRHGAHDGADAAHWAQAALALAQVDRLLQER